MIFSWIYFNLINLIISSSSLFIPLTKLSRIILNVSFWALASSNKEILNPDSLEDNSSIVDWIALKYFSIKWNIKNNRKGKYNF